MKKKELSNLKKMLILNLFLCKDLENKILKSKKQLSFMNNGKTLLLLKTLLGLINMMLEKEKTDGKKDKWNKKMKKKERKKKRNILPL